MLLSFVNISPPALHPIWTALHIFPSASPIEIPVTLQHTHATHAWGSQVSQSKSQSPAQTSWRLSEATLFIFHGKVRGSRAGGGWCCSLGLGGVAAVAAALGTRLLLLLLVLVLLCLLFMCVVCLYVNRSTQTSCSAPQLPLPALYIPLFESGTHASHRQQRHV